jgi:hypothetical protein
MLIYIIEIYSLDRGGSSLTAIRLIIVNIKNSSIFKDSKVSIS